VLGGLDRDPVALAAAGGDQRMRDLRGQRGNIVVVDDGSVRDDEQRLLRPGGKVVFEQRVEIGVQ